MLRWAPVASKSGLMTEETRHENNKKVGMTKIKVKQWTNIYIYTKKKTPLNDTQPSHLWLGVHDTPFLMFLTKTQLFMIKTKSDFINK